LSNYVNHILFSKVETEIFHSKFQTKDSGQLKYLGTKVAKKIKLLNKYFLNVFISPIREGTRKSDSDNTLAEGTRNSHSDNTRAVELTIGGFAFKPLGLHE